MQARKGLLFPGCMLALVSALSAPPQAADHSQLDTLDDLTVTGVPERQRQAGPSGLVLNPDVITVTRKGDVDVKIVPLKPLESIRFRRPSAARQAANKSDSLQFTDDLVTLGGGLLIREVALRIKPEPGKSGGKSEGMPAVVEFGPHLSLFNVDHVRLVDTGNPTFTKVSNAIDVETRQCVRSMGFGDRGDNYPNRYLLIGDTLRDCNQAVKSREGDLFFAESVPESLRQDLHEIYDPINNRFARWLGSEPAMMFVSWQPAAAVGGLRFATNWGRGALVLLEGGAWKPGVPPPLRNALWDYFAQDQLHRRIAWQQGRDVFVEAAMDYLLMLARADRDQDISRRLSAALPEWITGCARDAGNGIRFGRDCAILLQFVYDAAIRAQSKGESTVFNTWNDLLNESYRRGKSGVELATFMATSGEASRIAQQLSSDSPDWAGFSSELARLGVQLKMTPGPRAPQVEVMSVANFRD